jgi:hypothetical protein
MKTLVLALLAVAGLAGCIVVPAEPAAVVGVPRAYINPPPLVVVPGWPYYYGYGGGGYGRGYGARRYRPYY